MLVGLYDFGKVIVGFQVKWLVGCEWDEVNGLWFDMCLLKVIDYVCVSVLFLCLLLLEKGDVFLLWILYVLQVISVYYGYNFIFVDIEWVVQ